MKATILKLVPVVVAYVALSLVPVAHARQLSYANHLPASHPVNVAMKAYFNSVTKATNGELKFQMLVGGTMGGGSALLGLLRDSIVDSAFENALYSSSALPTESMIAQILYPNPLVLAGAQNEMFLLHCPECRAELKKNNVEPLMYYSTPTYFLMCTKPIKTLEDAEGVRVRSVGSFGRMTAAIGMTPVNLTSDEVYQALQRGQLACAVGSPDWLASYSLRDVVKYITDYPLGAIGGLMNLGFNSSSWASLSSAQKQAIQKGLAAAVAHIEFNYVRGSHVAMKDAKQRKIEFVQPGPKLKARVEKFNQDAFSEAEKKGKGDGVKDVAELMNTYGKLLDKWKKIVAKVGDDQKAYSDALYKEVFSRVK